MAFSNMRGQRQLVPITATIIFTLLLLCILQDSAEAGIVKEKAIFIKDKVAPLFKNRSKEAAQQAEAVARALANEARLKSITGKIYLALTNVVCFTVILLLQIVKK